MPGTHSNRESRRSSKSSLPSNSKEDAEKRSERRREKAKSSQIYESSRRGSKQAESGLGSLSERPKLKGRTNSTPVVSRVAEPGHRDGTEEREQTREGRSRQTSQAGLETHAGAQDEDEVAGVVGTVKKFQPFQNPELSEPIPDINIAVLGAEGVGKSTFVQKTLELPHPPSEHATERKISVGGTDYVVRLLELSINDVDIDDDDETVSWPETIEDKMMPKIDGALALYSVQDRGSVENIFEMLNAIHKAGLPSLLISCKCDTAPDEREVDPLEVERTARRGLRNLNTLQTSSNSPDTHKRGLSMIFRDILTSSSKERTRSVSANRKRAQSTAVRPVSPRPPSDRGHARAASEAVNATHKDQRHSRHDSSLVGYGSSDRLRVPLPSETSQEDMGGSFLFEESASEESPISSRSSSEETIPPPVAGVTSTAVLSENGATFDELVDRLLAQPTSKADGKFGAVFLALYRKFAAPGRLLEAIVQRFDALDRNGSANLIKISSQQRYVDIMEQWVGSYPGDFAFPKTKRRMRTFVSKLGQERIFAVAAKEMNAELDGAQDDDDTNWAYNDRDRAASGDDARTSLSSSASTRIDDPQFSLENFTLSGATLLNDSNTSLNGGYVTAGDVTRSMSSATLSSQILANVEAAQKQAQLLQPLQRQPITKIQWRLMMECPDDILARELTRMDWIMFSSIRPRDLVRQVSLNAEQRANCKNLTHVNRMIEHFNQLAFWVANYILLRDKPKHRALMLEKFMRIARKLREMNNYNALGAIIAGIKSTAIHRLAATRDLIPPNVGKDWMKLEILMAPSRSHFAYRLAWENSSTERIPYLPLHRRDLVSAEEGNKTFIGDEKDGRINWKKFEIMGDVIVSMQKAQGMPYKGFGSRGNEQIKELVLDVKLVKDEDELFERSKQLEASSGPGGSTTTKFKDFFKR